MMPPGLARICRIAATVVAGVVAASCGDRGVAPEDPGGSGGAQGSSPPSAGEALRTVPALEGDRPLIGPLADAWARIDPNADGWESEAFSEAASASLKRLAKAIAHPDAIDSETLGDLLADQARSGPLRAEALTRQHRSGTFEVQSGEIAEGGEGELLPALRSLLTPFDPGRPVRVELKLWKVGMPDAAGGAATGEVIVHLVGAGRDGRRLQINSDWSTRWERSSGEPKLVGVRAQRYEEVRSIAGGLFADSTAAVFAGVGEFERQLRHSTDHWRARIARDFGLDVVANHGFAFGDVTGDGLDDLYLCQQGGLPNRLFERRVDGTLRDITADSGTGWLDYCASALLVDFDNDGDRDLAVSQDFKILFMDNLGGAKFELAFGLGLKAQTFSISAADYDLDGDLDLYLCGYNPAADRGESGHMGEPMPYHDARNGGRNTLLRNDGGWEFTDVTDAVGLGANNDRFSFAASWIDYDRDGDPDLHVANDYGRNNFYQNDGGKFRDRAAELGLEDMSAGMSSSWGDADSDGVPDLYVSNMFSSAGNRITYQRQFKTGAGAELLGGYRRHARGNSLFTGSADGGAFADVSEEAGVTMGRWAWGSRFADLDNDGREDLLVANGFITAPDTGDL